MKYYENESGRVIMTVSEPSNEWKEIEKSRYAEMVLIDLDERVQQFSSMSLPGQPMGMHMGTSYLVNDLWREVQRLRKEDA